MSSTDVDTQHTDVVHDTQFDYYGRYLATCSSDRTVKIFATGDGGNNTLVATLTGHEGPVWMVNWAHPQFGTALASCSFDHKAIVWKPGPTPDAPWKPSTIVTAHTSSVNACAFAPASAGLCLATAGSDGHVYVTTCANGAWIDPVSVATAEASGMAHPMGAMSVSWSPTQTDDEPTILASGGADSRVKLWSKGDTGYTLRRSFDEHSDWVRDVAFSPDAASRHITLASCAQDKTVVIRRAARDEPDNWQTSPTVTFEEVVWRLSWSPCGTMLLVTTADSQVFVLKQGATFGDEWVRAPLSTNADK